MEKRRLDSVRRKLRSIRMQATRHKRANDSDRELLLRDLEFIEAWAEKALEEFEEK